MITVAPPELCSGFIPGQKVKLIDLIHAADERDSKIHNSPGTRPSLNYPVKYSKYWYQNCCWNAMGKCDRCRAPDCTDRNWRDRGYVP